MDTTSALFRDVAAILDIDSSLNLLHDHTTFTQFAQGLEGLRSVAFNPDLSEQVQLYANKQLMHAGERGISWFAKVPVNDCSSEEFVDQVIVPQHLPDLTDLVDLLQETNAMSAAYFVERQLNVLDGRDLGKAGSGDIGGESGPSVVDVVTEEEKMKKGLAIGGKTKRVLSVRQGLWLLAVLALAYFCVHLLRRR
ncbi:uncharacterized protein AB675_3020 [Cyphellophora attinorum]|uniref:Uncharacterized protein n=1 Tax=Cyphellophora attinorum TaxID=1664694 RepID=A0A0N1HQV7_9EURO|nr:uncharacterized protein AB675_3020 [Phialophora attinorum]KPI38003.1 hypothetical protein AB675_3020 [Phialophora attinorum]